MSHQESETTAFTVRVEKVAAAALDALAASTDRSRNWLVNCAIDQYIEQNRWQIARIEEGMRAADAADYAADSDVDRVFTKYTPSA